MHRGATQAAMAMALVHGKDLWRNKGRETDSRLVSLLKSGVGGEREDSKGNFNVPAQGKAATRSFSVMLPALNMHLVTS